MSYWLNAIHFQDGVGWAVGSNGLILKYDPTHSALSEHNIRDNISNVLLQNYPNPFHGTTTIRYGLPKSEPIRVEVFNIAGQSVRVLANVVQSPGYKLLKWNGEDETGMRLGCGVYFYRITTPEYEATKKMLLLR